jgi:hypothetical protein
LKLKGLTAQLDTFVEAAVMDDRVAGISSCEQDLQGGADGFGLSGDLRAGHAPRKDHVGKQEIHSGLAVEEPQSRRPIMGLQHAIAELAEAVDRVGSDVVVILTTIMVSSCAASGLSVSSGAESFDASPAKRGR